MEVEVGGVTKDFLDFGVEDSLCFCESGDEEYLKERGTSILKGRVRARDASGGNADDVDSYYQIGRNSQGCTVQYLYRSDKQGSKSSSSLNLEERELGADDCDLWTR